MIAHRKPCSCVLRYTEWSKKSFNCGISIFCPLTRTPPPDDFAMLLLFVRCLLVDFGWCVPPLLLFDELWLFAELFVELLVSDSDTSRLGCKDLLVNDNFSVVSSSRLLGGFTVVWVCSFGINVVSNEFPSATTSAVVTCDSVVAMRPVSVVVRGSEIFLESETVRRSWNQRNCFSGSTRLLAISDLRSQWEDCWRPDFEVFEVERREKDSIYYLSQPINQFESSFETT